MAQRVACNFSDSLIGKAEGGKMRTSIGATSFKLADGISKLFQLDVGDLKMEQMTFEVDSMIGGSPKRLDAKFLSKICCIKHDEAEKVLEQSTILLKQGAPKSLSNRFPTV